MILILGHQKTSMLLRLQQGHGGRKRTGPFRWLLPLAKQMTTQNRLRLCSQVPMWAVSHAHTQHAHTNTNPTPVPTTVSDRLDTLRRSPGCTFLTLALPVTPCFAQVTPQAETVSGFTLCRINSEVYTQTPPQSGADL